MVRPYVCTEGGREQIDSPKSLPCRNGCTEFHGLSLHAVLKLGRTIDLTIIRD
jgi:hypothetical protein